MERRIFNMVFLVTIAMAVMLQSSSANKTHVVGDALGWVIPPGPAAYAMWEATQTFRVGDILVFKFNNAAHNVARVTRENFEACNGSHPLVLYSDSPANVTINKIGDMYFLSTVNGDCSSGQKLAVNVKAAA